MGIKQHLQNHLKLCFAQLQNNLGSTDNKTLDLKTFPTYIDFKSKNVKLVEESFKKN
jgi:hypothetical protein